MGSRFLGAQGLPARGKPWMAHRSVGCTGSWLWQTDPGYLGHPQLFSQRTSLPHEAFGEREAPLQQMQAQQCCCSSALALPACTAGPSEGKGNRISTKTFQQTTGSALPHLSSCSPRQPRVRGPREAGPSSLPQLWQPLQAEPRSHTHTFQGTPPASAALRVAVPRCCPCDSPARAVPRCGVTAAPASPGWSSGPGTPGMGAPRPAHPAPRSPPAPGAAGAAGETPGEGASGAGAAPSCGEQSRAGTCRGDGDPRLPLAAAAVSRCPLVPLSRCLPCAGGSGRGDAGASLGGGGPGRAARGLRGLHLRRRSGTGRAERGGPGGSCGRCRSAPGTGRDRTGRGRAARSGSELRDARDRERRLPAAGATRAAGIAAERWSLDAKLEPEPVHPGWWRSHQSAGKGAAERPGLGRAPGTELELSASTWHLPVPGVPVPARAPHRPEDRDGAVGTSPRGERG